LQGWGRDSPRAQFQRFLGRQPGGQAPGHGTGEESQGLVVNGHAGV